MSKKFLISSVVVLAAFNAVLVWSASSVFAVQNALQEQISQGEAVSPTRTEKQEPATDEKDGTSTSNGTPRIFFPVDTHDFGTVSRGAKLTHNFKVLNTGDAPLRIIKAKGG